MKRLGFTLIELLVVISIIIIVLAVSMPVWNKLTQGNARAQGRNMVSAFLAGARAHAISTHREAGVMFYDMGGLPPRTAVVMISQAETNSIGNSIFTDADVVADNWSSYASYGVGSIVAYSGELYSCIQAAPAGTGSPDTTPAYWTSEDGVIRHADPSYLPNGVEVASLGWNSVTNSSEANTSANSTAAGRVRVIMFDGNGRLENRKGICRDAGTSSALMAGLPTENGALPNNPDDGYSTSAVMLFDATDLASKNFPSTSTGDASRDTWIQKNSDMIVVNAYTGNLLK